MPVRDGVSAVRWYVLAAVVIVLDQISKQIVLAGIRPGERLHEILFATQEPTTETGIAGVMAARPNEPALTTVRHWTTALGHAVERDDRETIRSILRDAIPEFSAQAAQ